MLSGVYVQNRARSDDNRIIIVMHDHYQHYRANSYNVVLLCNALNGAHQWNGIV